MTVTYNPFVAEYGFESPGFSVDKDGNLVAKSLSLATDAAATNFQVSNVGQVFDIDGESPNPTISVERGGVFTFTLTLDANIDWNIFTADGVLYNRGLQYVSLEGAVLENAQAQGQRVGDFTFTVPVDAPDVLFYANSAFTVRGRIDVTFPTLVGIGQFEQLSVTGPSSLQTLTINDVTQSISETTGSVIIKGGVAIAKNLNIGGEVTISDFLNAQSVSTTELETDSVTNLNTLTLNAGSSLDIQIGSTSVGSVTGLGLTINILNSGIENSPIGETTPSTAKFTSAEVSSTPITGNDITNKTYTDTISTALAIALGV